MNLEEIEQKTLSYLKQVSNPLVPLDRLARYLKQNGVLGDMTEAELLTFLHRHELFRVMEPPGLGDDPGMNSAMASLGLNTKPYVILDTRIPTKADVVVGLDEQLLRMAEALIAAAAEAKEKGEDARREKIERMLDRIKAARKHLKEVE